ncbi:MAG: tetratricopeptide repeat protein, partial [Nitrospinota bacterium]
LCPWVGAEEMSPAERAKKAEELFQEGYYYHQIGRYEEAIVVYRRSLELKRTAKTHTFLGWSLGHLGKLDAAIAQCKKAIALDPDYGNPYNDIGVYLMQKKLYDEAIPYLKKAMKAKNYCCPFFPHHNLGSIYAVRGEYEKALREFKEALKLKPDFLPAQRAIELIRSQLQAT